MVTKSRQQRASVPELKRRIMARASSGPEDVWLAQAIDLAALYGRDPVEFRGLIEQGVVKRRRAYYLIKVGQLLHDGTISPAKAAEIGWTKLQLAARRIEDGEKAATVLVDAREHSAHQLNHMMRKGGEPTKRRCVMMYLGPDQYRQFRAAMRAHGATRVGRGLAGTEEALMSVIRATR